MASIKETLRCIGVDTSGSVTVLGGLFGFQQGRVPKNDAGDPSSVTVKQLLRDLKGKHFHVNVIRTGIDLYAQRDLDRIDWSILRVRQVFRQEELTVGRVLHWDIHSDESDGLHDIGSAEDATQLTLDWSVDNDGQDVFFVVSTPESFVGISNIDGPCDKDAKGRSGSIVELDRSSEDNVARTFAHEIGHYLGLSHKNDTPDNLMCQTKKANDAFDDSTDLTSSQGTDIRDHCSVTDGC